jgi:hypothetical protein
LHITVLIQSLNFENKITCCTPCKKSANGKSEVEALNVKPVSLIIDKRCQNIIDIEINLSSANDLKGGAKMEKLSYRDALVARYDLMKNQGLVDVKFLLRNTSEATTELVCREVEEMYAALERGESKALDFNDKTIQ